MCEHRVCLFLAVGAGALRVGVARHAAGQLRGPAGARAGLVRRSAGAGPADGLVRRPAGARVQVGGGAAAHPRRAVHRQPTPVPGPMRNHLRAGKSNITVL
jgi:hypothetical protein